MDQNLVKISEEIVEDSIKFCEKIFNIDRDKVIRLLREDNLRVNARLRYCIAERIIGYFVLYGINVISAYIFGSTVHEDTTRYCSDINIILCVDKKKDKYLDKITKIDGQLTKTIVRITGRPFPRGFTLLDVKLVTQGDIDNRRDFACLINSIYDPACKIYPKQ